MTLFDLVHYSLVGLGVMMVIVIIIAFCDWLKKTIIKLHQAEQIVPKPETSTSHFSHHTEEHHVHHIHYETMFDDINAHYDSRERQRREDDARRPSSNHPTIARTIPTRLIPKKPVR